MKRFSLLSLFLFSAMAIAPALVAAYSVYEMNPNYKISIPEKRLSRALFLTQASFQQGYRQTLSPFISRSSVSTPTRRLPRVHFITRQRKSFSIRYNKPDSQLPLVVRQRNIRKGSLFRYARAQFGY